MRVLPCVLPDFGRPCSTLRLWLVFLTLFLPASSCVTRTQIVTPPQRVQQAKTLDRAGLTKLLEARGSLRSLQASAMRAHFIGGDQDTGKVERYIGVPGYALAERPDRLRITLQNPVTKTSL